ncbi:MAG TPA: TonB C-terminal domain-containing protein [Blastocatellia bacterium]|nr:TonB C-terminal domain-containing protein [Blastocatellia bacterium]
MSARHRQAVDSDNGSMPRLGILLSVALHLLVAGALLVMTSQWMTTEMVAAGPGEGGEGGGGAIDVGVSDPSAILGFARPQPISNIGERDNTINNTNVEHKPREEETEDVVPRTDKEPLDPKSIKTDKPVVNQTERIFTGKEERGKTDSPTAQVGRTYGTPTPTMIGGVAIGSGGGVGTGLPGGSEYGRRIQRILSSHYHVPQLDGETVQTVVIVVRISRDGRILNLGDISRLDPSSIRQRAQNALITNAAVSAINDSNPLPPIPSETLPGAGEVRVNLIFRYPK